jgi:hypothetical protein
MKCPYCRRRIISFYRWGCDQNAGNYQCPHCDIPLQAGPPTRYLLWAWLSTLPLGLAFAILIRNILDLPHDSPVIWVLPAWMAGLCLATFLVWRFGSYERVPDPPPIYPPDSDAAFDYETARSSVRPVSADNLVEFVRENPIALLHVWAPWNEWDHTCARQMQTLARKFPTVAFAHIDFDIPGNCEMIRRLFSVNVLTVPTVLWFADGKLVATHVGLLSSLRADKLPDLVAAQTKKPNPEKPAVLN